MEMMKPGLRTNLRSVKSWMLLFFCFLYFAFCWVLYSFTVEPLYGIFSPPRITADSGAYFEMAGLSDQGGGNVDSSGLVALGGSSLGPVAIAIMGRTVFGVACINCALFLLTVYWAGLIRGVRRELFVLLMALDAQTVPTLMTLNKEILAIAGIAAFGAYMFPADGRRRGSVLLFLAAILLSVMARWEQAIILVWFASMEWRHSPFRGKPRRAVVALLLLCSIAYAAAIHLLNVNLAGFLAQIEGGGLIVRLYNIQEKGGYFLVAFPKILMNLAGRWVTPIYFLTDYWADLFGQPDWQNAYIGPLSSLAMIAMVAYPFLRNRLRLGRPLVHLAITYFIFTAINPFIQPRYMYPGYAILALEMARRKNTLEPLRKLPQPPALPPSYRTLTVHS